MAKEKYSYIYKGQIVRNSNRIYFYGLVNHYDAVVACSATEQGAQKQKSWQLNYYKRQYLRYIAKGDQEAIDRTKQEIANIEKWHTVKLELKEN